MTAARSLFVRRLDLQVFGFVVLTILILVGVSQAGVITGVGSGGCFERTTTEVCFNGECWDEIVWYPVECGSTGGGGGGTGGGTGGGGSGGGGGGTAGTHPDDDTQEAREESAMCYVDRVSVARHCSQTNPTIQCCFSNSDDGHLCTACNCAGCCDNYWDCSSVLTQTMCWGCKTDCVVGFSGGQAAGTDDSSDCDRYDGSPFM